MLDPSHSLLIQTAAADAPTGTHRSALEAGSLPIAGIADIALREGNSSLPIYRAHRWFARRLGSQFRSILTALALPASATTAQFWKAYRDGVDFRGAVMLDPFLGGGTALVEARRLGARVIGCDIDPVAAAISRFELEAGAPTGPDGEVDGLLARVGDFVRSYHETVVDGVVRPVLHHFWVETHVCGACNRGYDLHPHYQLAHDKAKRKQWVVCKGCDDVHELPLSRKLLKCGCGTETTLEQGPFQEGNCVCPYCGHIENHAQPSRPAPQWRLFAQEYVVGTGRTPERKFKRVTQEDLNLFATADAKLAAFETEFGPAAPGRLIPAEGRSSQRPLIHGITSYRHLFNARQLLHLGVLAHSIAGVEHAASRRLLSLAFSEHLTTNCMYTAYAFGYRRTSALFSIHGYRHIVRPVEINPWLDGVGRGTFLNVLGKLKRVKSYAQAPYVYAPTKAEGMMPSGTAETFGKTVSSDGRDVVDGQANAAVLNHSSESLDSVPSGSVDVCLTDPPYWDNVSYSELSDFYLAWHQHIGLAEGAFKERDVPAPMSASLAAVKRSDASKQTYIERLTAVFKECRRTLKPTGRLVFTYHHVGGFAWFAVARALSSAGFRCVSVVPMRGEGQGGLHSYDGTIKWDAVMVCVPGTPDARPLAVTEGAIRDAAKRAVEYAKHLGKRPELGFRAQDKLNLERALLCGAALNGAPHGEGLDLELALAAP